MILEKMLQRLQQSLLRGPSLNCRPHNSRQRIDLRHFTKLGEDPSCEHLNQLLTGKMQVTFKAHIPHFEKPEYPEAEWSDEQKKAQREWKEQVRVLRKLSSIASEAVDYYNDHGEHALYLALPILSLPPASGRSGGMSKSRVLAPLAFVPVDIVVRQAARPGITIKASGDGADLLFPNPGLMTLIEQQTGIDAEELFSDDSAENPWRELKEIIYHVAKNTGAKKLELDAESLLESMPRASNLDNEPCILSSAILGLFPINNPGLMRDTRWMIENEKDLSGPIKSFLTPAAISSPKSSELPEVKDLSVTEQTETSRNFKNEYFITHSDPCQASAVHLSENSPVLVLHGPPGTGKSQTIVNMIGNHLARGEKVLFVCDKRTALDVVKYRLDALGLGHLCGVIHDPQRDRRDFYMGLRQVLEDLSDAKTDQKAQSQLETVNKRLNALHTELREAFSLLHSEDKDGYSYHDLVGRWLASHSESSILLETLGDEKDSWKFTLKDHEEFHSSVDELLMRARESNLNTNPWLDHSGLSLADWLSHSPSELESKLSKVELCAARIDKSPHDGTLPILQDIELGQQAGHREELIHILDTFNSASPAIITQFFTIDSNKRTKLVSDWTDGKYIHQRASEALPRDIVLAIIAEWPTVATINSNISHLKQWIEISKKWTRIFSPSKKKAAIEALTQIGVLDINQARQAISYYETIKAKILISDMLRHLPTSPEPEDDEIAETIASVDIAIKLRSLLKASFTHAQSIILASIKQEQHEKLKTSTTASILRLKNIIAFQDVAEQSKLFTSECIAELSTQFCDGESSEKIIPPYQQHLPQLESVLRLRLNLDQLPESLRQPCHWLAEHADMLEDQEAHALLESVALERLLKSILQETPALAHIDTTRINAAFDELNERLSEKQILTRSVINNYWTSLQKHRLLSGTGTRLNSLGASVRQRLMVRGKRALKLRQMVAAGADITDGDPLFDLCPVWMASADTVAQIFRREASFDSVVFDEASQCRLEEALPVLLRSKRVVIAGDPKQLPPTRFFESALVESDQTDAETTDELHDQQMSETEDLLTGALNLEVHEAFLDVHYRSRNEALIGFSNENFYNSRLQPIPGHPKHKAFSAPITLHNVDGTYLEQTNADEAKAIVQKVKELLDDQEPPSIGIASFNLKQRNLIQDEFEKVTLEDRAFAEKYETAKHRRGADSFEGLFIKNLENVQGDERDHILISTTFGPDDEGKFRRNFGALSRRGGERRLNVLVTRARSAIHVFTSIPAGEYRHSPMPGHGESVNGRLLLYAYLRYAERLEELFEQYQTHLENLRSTSDAESVLEETQSPSALATSIGNVLASSYKTGNTVHWGNDGFCIDVALTHPTLPEDVTIGVLTDFNRFRKTSDPIDWERFRSLVFQSQGWEIHRLWSPRILRDVNGELKKVIEKHEECQKVKI